MVNTVTVIPGTIIGFVFRSKIPKKVIDSVMVAVGLCVLCIGISGSLGGHNIIVLINSMVFGTGVGALLDIADKINKFGYFVSSKFKVANFLPALAFVPPVCAIVEKFLLKREVFYGSI